MSKQVDERVVSMQFDNRQFEKNVGTTMSTLDKLKQSLNLSGASKGLENVNSAANKVNMSGLASGVEAVRLKFSALEVMGVTALANITNSAVNAGKRIVSALTIEPVSDGFKEYEMTMNAIQTTMSATGKTAKEVEDELVKLDEYADKTVYSTADMLNNLPKFTNAGVDLEVATKAMIGIANATAHAGGDAGKASIAFYNLGQAIGTGYLTRMDYNSINNAGIATIKWKEQMIDAAIAAGTLRKAGDDAYEAGGKTFTMQQLFIDGLQHQWATTDVMLKVFGDYGDATTDIGKAAYSSAQDIKTYTMMMDSLKATAGTGWKETWQHIFGGLDEAKAFWTGMTNAISGMITGMADFRNKVLAIALGSGFDGLLEPLKGVKNTVRGIKEPFEEVTKTMDDYNRVVKEVIRGKWGHTQKRWDALTEAGYDWITVQNMVNEKLGNSKRRHTDFVIGQSTMAKTTEESTEANNEFIASLTEMTDAELEALGLTVDQIDAIKTLKAEADKLGLSVEDFIANLDKIDGRWALIESFKNIWKAISQIFDSIKGAWEEIFPPKSIEEIGQALYDAIAAFHKFTLQLSLTGEDADNLRRTFKGLFALLDIVLTLVGGPLKYAFNGIIKLLGMFDINLLEHTANIGDAIVAARDWLDENNLFVKAFEVIVPLLKDAYKAICDWVAGLKDANPAEVARAIINGLGSAIGYVGSLIGSLFDTIRGKVQEKTGQIPEDLVAGLVNGLRDKMGFVGEVLKELGNIIITKIKEVLGIHSPSTVFYAIGGFIIAGLIGGLLGSQNGVFETLGGMGEGIASFFEGIDWGSLIAAGISAGLVATLYKISSALSAFTEPLEGVGDILHYASKTVKQFNKVLKAFKGVLNSISMAIKAEALKSIAIALAILVGAIALLTFLDIGKVWNAVGVIAVLAVILGGLSVAVGKFGTSGALDLGKFSLSVLGISAALLIMAAAIKVVESVDPERAGSVTLAMIGMLAAFVGIATLFGKMKMPNAKNIALLGSMLMSMAGAMLMLAIVAKILGGVDEDAFKNMTRVMNYLTLVMAGFVLMTKLGNAKKLGNMLLGMAGAMLALALVAKILGTIDVEAFENTKKIMNYLFLVMGGLVLLTKLGNAKKLGGMLLGMAGAMLALAVVAKVLETLNPDKFEQIGWGMVGLLGMMAVLVLISNWLPKGKLAKINLTLLTLAFSVALLATVALVLSLINPANLWKGVAVVGALALFMGGLILATSKVKQCKGELITLTVAVALLAAAVGILSMLDPIGLAASTAALSVVMLVFANVLQTAGKMGKSKALSALAMMVAALGIIAVGLTLLSQMPADRTLGAAASLSLVLLAMVAAMRIVGKVKKIPVAPLATMIGMIAVLGVVLSGLALLPLASSLGAVAALSLMLLALSASMFILSNIKSVPVTIIVALIAVATALVLLTNVLSTVGGMSGGALLQAVIGLGVALALLAVGLNLMNGTVTGSASLLIAAAALNVLAPAMNKLGSMSLAKIGKGLLAMAGAFAVLGIAGLLLGPLVPVILGLSAAIAIIGVGILAMGAGMELVGYGLSLMATGFSALIAVMQTGAPVLAAGLELIVTTLINLIPYLAVKIGEGIIVLCETLIAATPVIVQTAVLIITTIINALVTVIPLVVDAIGLLITSVLETIAKYTPRIVKAVFNILLACLEGIAKNISRVVELAIDVVLGFIDGIARSIPDVVQSAYDLIISFINGIADGIRNNNTALIEAVDNLITAIIDAIGEWFTTIVDKGAELVNKIGEGVSSKIADAKKKIGEVISGMVTKIGSFVAEFKQAAKDLIDGLIKGIGEKFDEAVQAVKDLGEAMWNGVCEFFAIKSPSRKMMEVGRYIDEGMAIGLSKYANQVVSAGKDVANSAYTSMTSTIARITDAVNGNIDAQPTIRPVLDLSGVTEGAGAINGLFNNPSLGVMSNVRSINAMMNRQNGTNSDVVSAISDLKNTLNNRPAGNTYNINGINYSEGDEVAQALETIIRAARVERRA